MRNMIGLFFRIGEKSHFVDLCAKSYQSDLYWIHWVTLGRLIVLKLSDEKAYFIMQNMHSTKDNHRTIRVPPAMHHPPFPIGKRKEKTDCLCNHKLPQRRLRSSGSNGLLLKSNIIHCYITLCPLALPLFNRNSANSPGIIDHPVCYV